MPVAAIASPAGFLTGAANLATCFAALAVAVAAGAYLVQRRDSHTQLLLGMTEHVDGVAKVFVEFPEMRPYFHAGEEAKGTTDLQRAEAIAVYLSNAMDFVFVHLGKIDDAGKAAWERYFAYVFQNSPVLRDFLEEHKDWYGRQFQEHVKGLEADFEQSVRVKQRLALQSPFFFGPGGQFGPPR
jgi:hypothetical protein